MPLFSERNTVFERLAYAEERTEGTLQVDTSMYVQMAALLALR
jgi:hypothetical protein